MDEKPKSIRKKSWTGWDWLRAWLAVAVATFFIVSVVTLLIPSGPRSLSDWWPALFSMLVVSVILAAVFWTFIRCFFYWRNFKRFLFGLACLVTLIALFYAEEDWRGWHAWNQFKHEWEAKGEKFDWQSVVPLPVPDDQNFALTPIVFTSYGGLLTRDGKVIPDKDRDRNFVDRLSLMAGDGKPWTNAPDFSHRSDYFWHEAKKIDLNAWQNYFRSEPPTNSPRRAHKNLTNAFPIAPQPQTPAQDVLLALSKYDSVIGELREASRLPYSRFPLDYESQPPAGILLPHLAALKRCSQVLQLRAVAELQNGQSEKAIADVKLSLRLTDTIHTEPFLISHLVRIAIVNLALQPIYEGLAEHKWSGEQLVALDVELAKFDFLADYRLSMRGEMGLQGGNIDYLRNHPRQLADLSGDAGGDYNPPLPGGIVSRLIPSGWFYQNRLNCARMMAEFYIPLAEVNQEIVSPAAVRHADEVLRAGTRKTTPYNILEIMLFPSLGNAVKRFAYAQSSVDLARVALALERYRLAHGEYPESLDALAPQFINKLPHDIIGGGPLRYRRTSDAQFVLYSVGWNETDDGGAVVFKKKSPSDESLSDVDTSSGDWVWRYPQK